VKHVKILNGNRENKKVFLYAAPSFLSILFLAYFVPNKQNKIFAIRSPAI